MEKFNLPVKPCCADDRINKSLLAILRHDPIRMDLLYVCGDELDIVLDQSFKILVIW